MSSLSLNRVFLGGNLTRDPELRYLPSGMAVTEFGMAINERYKDSANNEWKEKAVFVELVVWDRQAQTCGEYLRKGSAVLVEGRLQFDQWETPQGDKRSKLRVNASRVHFISQPGERTRRDGEGAPGGGGSGAAHGEGAQGGGSESVDADFRVPSAPADEDNLPF